MQGFCVATSTSCALSKLAYKGVFFSPTFFFFVCLFVCSVHQISNLIFIPVLCTLRLASEGLFFCIRSITCTLLLCHTLLKVATNSSVPASEPHPENIWMPFRRLLSVSEDKLLMQNLVLLVWLLSVQQHCRSRTVGVGCAGYHTSA